MAKPAPNWPKAKSLYEAGNGWPFIHSQTSIPVRTLKYRAKKEKWQKNRIAPVLHDREVQALERAAEKRGITRAKVLDKVAELIDAQSVAVITTQGAVSLCPMLPEAKANKEGKSTFQGIEYDVVPDRRTQLEATKIAADVLGMKRDPATENIGEAIMAWVRST